MLKPARTLHGHVLPPLEIRYCGSEFKSDEVFLESGESGRDEARRLRDDFDVADATRLLEIGAGPGRLSIGLIAESVPIGNYAGVDIDDGAMRWCRRNISRRHPSFRFVTIDADNERYNPDGTTMGERF